jgi:hypothetical protein
MANQAVWLWEAVLQGLRDITSGNLTARPRDALVRLFDMPELPKASWKRLVLDMQVREPSHNQSAQRAQRPDCLSCISS